MKPKFFTNVHYVLGCNDITPATVYNKWHPRIMQQLDVTGLKKLTFAVFVKERPNEVNAFDQSIFFNTSNAHAETQAVSTMATMSAMSAMFISRAPCMKCAKAMAAACIDVVYTVPPVESSSWYAEQCDALEYLWKKDLTVRLITLPTWTGFSAFSKSYLEHRHTAAQEPIHA